RRLQSTKRSMARSSRIWLSMAAVAATVVVGLGLYLVWSWHRPLQPGSDPYVLKPGASLRALARQLHARGAVTEPYSFIWLGHVTGYSRQLKAGEYRFRPGISAADLLQQVVAGKVIEYPL